MADGGPCPGCGYEQALVVPAEVPSRIVEGARSYRRLLLPPDRER